MVQSQLVFSTHYCK